MKTQLTPPAFQTIGINKATANTTAQANSAVKLNVQPQPDSFELSNPEVRSGANLKRTGALALLLTSLGLGIAGCGGEQAAKKAEEAASAAAPSVAGKLLKCLDQKIAADPATGRAEQKLLTLAVSKGQADVPLGVVESTAISISNEAFCQAVVNSSADGTADTVAVVAELRNLRGGPMSPDATVGNRRVVLGENKVVLLTEAELAQRGLKEGTNTEKGGKTVVVVRVKEKPATPTPSPSTPPPTK
jgi:hypothetical protein